MLQSSSTPPTADGGSSSGSSSSNPQAQDEPALPAVLPDVLVQAMAWVLGEYGYMLSSPPQAELVHHLAAGLAHRAFHDPATRGYVVSAAVKLVAQTGG